MVDRESFRMAQKGKEEYLSELDLGNRTNNDQRKDIVKCEKIAEKQLFYGKNIQAQIEELSQLLDKAHYQKVHTRILLFNEADAIINKRMEGAQSAVNKMENSMQNIILQEMENLDGILIATTNLGTESSLVSGLMIVIELRSREQP